MVRSNSVINSKTLVMFSLSFYRKNTTLEQQPKLYRQNNRNSDIWWLN